LDEFYIAGEMMKSEILVARLSGAELKPVKLPFITDNLNEVSQGLPAGAYTTFRTYEGSKALWLDKHYQRLEETLALAGTPLQLDRRHISEGVRKMLADYQGDNARVRITVDATKNLGDVYIVLAPLVTPSAADYANGVVVISCDIGKRENPKAKLSNFISRAETIRNTLPKGVHEALIVNGGGQILEGLSSNFFAVRNGKLQFADDGALSGLTMKMVLEEADRLGIPHHGEGVCISEVEQIDEAFITSASRSILPVTEIDHKPVGDGKVGEVTKRLMEAFSQRLLKEIKLI
jgi:branched-chain amino acid aminotransferase